MSIPADYHIFPTLRSTICKSVTLYRLVIATFAVVMAVLYMIFPWCGDDVWYSIHLAPWLEGEDPPIIPWQAIVDTWREHYMHDNIRMGDNLMPLMLIMPKWISAAAIGACAGTMLHYAALLAGAGKAQPIRLAVITLLLTFFLPWHENMFTLAYGVNYVVSSALMLYVLYKFLLSNDPHAGATLSLAALLGIWHEGFAVPMILALSAVCLLCRMSSLRRWGIIAAMIPGVAILWLSPGQMGNTVTHFSGMPIFNILVAAKANIPFFIWLAIYIAIWFRWPAAGKTEAPWIITTAVVSVIVLYINFHITRGERVSWALILLSLIGIARGIFILWPNKRSRLTDSMTALIYLLLCIHFGYAVTGAIRQRRSMDSAVEMMRRNHGEPVWVDIVPINKMPIIAWRKPCSMLWERNKMVMRSRYFRRHEEWDSNRISDPILPTALRHITPLSGHPLPGDAGVREKDGFYFINGTIPEGTRRMVIDFGLFSKVFPVEPVEFTGSSGVTYTQIIPCAYYFPYFLLTPRGFDSYVPANHE